MTQTEYSLGTLANLSNATVDANAGTGGSGLPAVYSTNLTGATNNDITWTAVNAGTGGNDITIAYTAPADDDQAHVATVAVTGSAIVVTMAVASNGSTVTSLASEIIALVNADVAAGALVQGANKAGNDGSGLIAALVATHLAGGLSATQIPAASKNAVLSIASTSVTTGATIVVQGQQRHGATPAEASPWRDLWTVAVTADGTLLMPLSEVRGGLQPDYLRARCIGYTDGSHVVKLTTTQL